MRFINPKTDYAFKKIFGSDQSQEILISFLNAILYKEQDVIQELKILNPYSPAAIIGLKDTFLDVRAKLNNGSFVIIEMQLLNKDAFEKRVIYNAAKSYANQLEIGEYYNLLNPVIALTIVNFILFKDEPEIINHFVFKHQENDLIFDKAISLVFLELPKFNKQLSALETLVDKWIYFLKKAEELHEKPDTMSKVPALNKALEIANRANSSREELEEIDKRTMWFADQEGLEIKAKEIGRAEGIIEGEKIGIEKGRAEGEQIGIEKGQKQQSINLITKITRRKFGEIPDEILTKIEGLSLEQLELLGEEIVFFSSLDDFSTW
jgi:predicted transposase/invertase (TIGR01784 family)